MNCPYTFSWAGRRSDRFYRVSRVGRKLTEKSRCTYYFGAFEFSVETDTHKSGYVGDLESELAQGLQIAIERRLAIYNNLGFSTKF